MTSSRSVSFLPSLTLALVCGIAVIPMASCGSTPKAETPVVAPVATTTVDSAASGRWTGTVNGVAPILRAGLGGGASAFSLMLPLTSLGEAFPAVSSPTATAFTWTITCSTSSTGAISGTYTDDFGRTGVISGSYNAQTGAVTMTATGTGFVLVISGIIVKGTEGERASFDEAGTTITLSNNGGPAEKLLITSLTKAFFGPGSDDFSKHPFGAFALGSKLWRERYDYSSSLTTRDSAVTVTNFTHVRAKQTVVYNLYAAEVGSERRENAPMEVLIVDCIALTDEFVRVGSGARVSDVSDSIESRTTYVAIGHDGGLYELGSRYSTRPVNQVQVVQVPTIGGVPELIAPAVLTAGLTWKTTYDQYTVNSLSAESFGGLTGCIRIDSTGGRKRGSREPSTSMYSSFYQPKQGLVENRSTLTETQAVIETRFQLLDQTAQ